MAGAHHFSCFRYSSSYLKLLGFQFVFENYYFPVPSSTTTLLVSTRTVHLNICRYFESYLWGLSGPPQTFLCLCSLYERQRVLLKTLRTSHLHTPLVILPTPGCPWSKIWWVFSNFYRRYDARAVFEHRSCSMKLVSFAMPLWEHYGVSQKFPQHTLHRRPYCNPKCYWRLLQTPGWRFLRVWSASRSKE